MEYLEAREFLGQVRDIEERIRAKLLEKERWANIATNITANSNSERVQSTSSQQSMANAVAKCVDIQAELEKYLLELIEVEKDVSSVIEQLPAIQYKILHKMYIGKSEGNRFKYMSLREIANCYNKSYSWATTNHGRALKQVQEILNTRQ